MEYIKSWFRTEPLDPPELCVIESESPSVAIHGNNIVTEPEDVYNTDKRIIVLAHGNRYTVNGEGPVYITIQSPFIESCVSEEGTISVIGNVNKAVAKNGSIVCEGEIAKAVCPDGSVNVVRTIPKEPLVLRRSARCAERREMNRKKSPYSKK